jgi:hypothetical protein
VSTGLSQQKWLRQILDLSFRPAEAEISRRVTFLLSTLDINSLQQIASHHAINHSEEDLIETGFLPLPNNPGDPLSQDGPW